MKKYRSREYVEAIQFDGTKKCAYKIQAHFGAMFFYKYDNYSHALILDNIPMKKGMWLILDKSDPDWSWKLMRDDQFRESYEVQ
jgi:hypothetical protein